MQRQHTYVSFKALSKRFEDSMTDVTYLNFEGLNILTGLMTLLNVGLSTSLPESLNMKKYSLKVYEQMLSAREIPLWLLAIDQHVFNGNYLFSIVLQHRILMMFQSIFVGCSTSGNGRGGTLMFTSIPKGSVAQNDSLLSWSITLAILTSLQIQWWRKVCCGLLSYIKD